MIALLCFFLTLSVSPLKSRSRLEAENAVLRHQLIVLQRRVRGRVQLALSEQHARNEARRIQARGRPDECVEGLGRSLA